MVSLFARLHHDNRRAHIGMNVAVVRKCAGGLKHETIGTASRNGPAIKRLPVVTGYRVGC